MIVKRFSFLSLFAFLWSSYAAAQVVNAPVVSYYYSYVDEVEYTPLGTYDIPPGSQIIQTVDGSDLVILPPGSPMPSCTLNNANSTLTRRIVNTDSNGVTTSSISHTYKCLCATWTKVRESVSERTCAGLGVTYTGYRNYKQRNTADGCFVEFNKSNLNTNRWETFELQPCGDGGPRDDDASCFGPAMGRIEHVTTTDINGMETTKVTTRTEDFVGLQCTDDPTRIYDVEKEIYGPDVTNLAGRHHPDFPLYSDPTFNP